MRITYSNAILYERGNQCDFTSGFLFFIQIKMYGGTNYRRSLSNIDDSVKVVSQNDTPINLNGNQ